MNAVSVERPPSIKGFLLQAVLWLPLAFFLWFLLRVVVVAVPSRLALAALQGLLPGVVTGSSRHYESVHFEVTAVVAGSGLPADAIAVTLPINALMYCYGLAVLIGLVMATPLTWRRTFLQLAVGFGVLVVMQAFGVVGEMLKALHFDLGHAVQAGLAGEGYAEQAPAAGAVAQAAVRQALEARGLSAELIGLWYQFGYLILPAVTPVVVWILFNRRFIEQLGAKLSLRREPSAPAAGP